MDDVGQASAVARELPELTLIVDQLGKPPRVGSADEFAQWEQQLREVAEFLNTAAKLSGLHAAGAAFTTAALTRTWEIALAAFGPGRLMFGGDWPVSPLGGR